MHRGPDGETWEDQSCELLDPWDVDLKGLGTTALRGLVRRALWLPSQSAEDRVREGVIQIRQHGRYWPDLA